MLQSGQKLVLVEQKEASYRGLGFVISPRLLNHINSYKYMGDRLSILDFTLPTRSGHQLKCRVVNAYGPTSERTAEDPILLDNFYAEITSVISILARLKLFICDDFKYKLGKLTPEDAEAGAHSNMGSYCMGTRNSNGDTLFEFLSTNGFFASNAAFKHRTTCRHRRTWTGHIADSKRATGSSVTKAVFNQIDCVLWQKNATAILKDSRSNGDTDLNHDHRPVITRLRMDRLHLMHKHHTKGTG